MFFEVQFPPPISYGMSGGPKFNTTIIKGDDESEARSNGGVGLWEWSFSTSSIKRVHLEAFIAFQMLVQGRENGFRLKNWLDYKVIGGQIGVGDGTKTSFQAAKIYTVGAYSTVKTLKKLVAGTVKVYVDSSQVSATVNYNTGEIIVAAPTEGDIVTLDCEFDYMARFDQDYNPITLKAYSSSRSENIRIVEIIE